MCTNQITDEYKQAFHDAESVLNGDCIDIRVKSMIMIDIFKVVF